jgi:hypothetical protein
MLFGYRCVGAELEQCSASGIGTEFKRRATCSSAAQCNADAGKCEE